MPTAPGSAGHLHKFLISLAFAVLVATALAGHHVDAQRADAADPATAKLTTVLADLAGAVPQTAPGPTGQEAAPAVRFSLDTAPTSVQDASRAGRLRINANDEVQVYVLVGDASDLTIAQLEASGAIIEVASATSRRVQARVAVSRLRALAALPAVNAIRLPTYARPRTGSVTTEGDGILRAADVRRQWALDGSNVRVGVISDGLKGVFATNCTSCAGVANGPMSTSDLPSATGTRNSSGVLLSSTGGIVAKSFQANGDLEGLPPSSPVCAFKGAGGEGTALLEIVHDLAPGAKLSFANAGTDLEFQQAVNFLAASNDVVLDDIGFYGEPSDGTSAVSTNTAAALNNNANPIRAYFTSVGNDADEHYYGGYVDSGVDGTTISGVTTPGHLHLFQRTADTTDVLGLGSQPYELLSLPAGGEAAIFLTWNDTFGASGNNYDMYLVQQSTGRVVARSVDVQSGAQDPAEVIDYVNNTGAQDFFRIYVQNVGNAAQPKNLDLFAFEPECAASGPALLAAPRHERLNYNTAGHSVSAQADAAGAPAGVVAVGAICSASAAASGQSSAAPNESCLDTTNSTPEFFSSRGPTLDGRTKPDISAIDGVSITGAGSFPSPFFGTSAASPHMGGIAALLLQAAPCLMDRSTSTVSAATARARVRSLLLDNADPVTSGLPNNILGAGRVNAFATVQTTIPGTPGPKNRSFDANTPFGAAITPAQLGFTDPNNCNLQILNWTGGCGTGPNKTVTCPFGVSDIAIEASNNGFLYSPSVGMEITVTNFGVGASPLTAIVAAGQTATFTVTVAAQGGAYNSPVTLSCGNLPPQTSCTFSPPVVTPGTGSRTSVLTVTTASGTSASSVAAGPAARRPGFVTSAPMASGVAIFPASLAFGNQIVNTQSPPQLVYVTNSGGDTLNLTGTSVSTNFTYVSSCGATVAPGANCGYAVSFLPTVAGALTGTLTFADNASGSPHSVGLTGTGIAAPAATGPTPSGSYGIAINGTAGTLGQGATVTLVVQ